MKIEELKICFTGPSGSGKTTLCKHLQDEGLNWQSTSAWDVLNGVEKNILKEKFGYAQGGHQNVIQMGHANPEFAIAFQKMVKKARTRQLIRASGIFSDSVVKPGLVLDRSPIDNIAYMFMQSAMYMSERDIEQFITESIAVINQYVDILIFVPITDEQISIEDNKSRISNLFYQQYVSSVFQWVIEKYEHLFTIPVFLLDTWDLEERQEFLSRLLMDNSDGKEG